MGQQANTHPMITACLAWYDEPLPFLDRCVRSLQGIADSIVAVDGAWQLYPDGKPRSRHIQADTIEKVAREIGINSHIVTGRVWDSQVAKRDYLMREAAGPDGFSDEWLFVIDGDEHVVDADRAQTHSTLDATELDVATVLCHHLGNDLRTAAHIRRIYRANAGVEVHTAHNGYRTADGRWLHGDPAYVTIEPALPLPITIQHDHRNRGEQRNEAAKGYRLNRRHAQAEAWV